ncbi:siderophore-interacting protein [Nakamurella lactea]|uniref:siderophore-interacting protein n=1 Tax=Nakamurella lactea TaxID=459515 RepID=UPI00048FB006|nr:siderophore-interacting protein [Nakamurella lactea]
MTELATRTTEVLPWATFRVLAHRVQRLSPHLVRVTLRGTDPGGLADLADNGYDQRIKLILPPAGGNLDELPTGADWYRLLRAMPDRNRPTVRTYTIRAVRGVGTETAELDLDMVLHGVSGPASAWVCRLLEADASARSRPELQAAVLAPSAGHGGPHGGLEFVTSVTEGLLLAGDETALPAIAAILERLPWHATGTALIEVPEPADAITLTAPQGIRIVWLPRDGAGCGSRLAAAGTSWRPEPGRPQPGRHEAGTELPEPDDEELVWEVPDEPAEATASAAGPGIRAWIAGEAGAVKAIRRHLVGECGLARQQVAFMGYWRLGRAES